MRPNSIVFFATKADLDSLLAEVEGLRELQYVQTALSDSSEFAVRRSLRGDDLGIVQTGISVAQKRYLVAEAGDEIVVRPVPQKKGGIKYAIDQRVSNPRTVIFAPGGQFGDRVLVQGDLATGSTDPKSVELFRLFLKPIRANWGLIQGAYVGDEAGALLDQGWRLTQDVRSPVEYDVRYGK